MKGQISTPAKAVTLDSRQAGENAGGLFIIAVAFWVLLAANLNLNPQH